MSTLYNVLRRPLITEKGMGVKEDAEYAGL